MLIIYPLLRKYPSFNDGLIVCISFMFVTSFDNGVHPENWKPYTYNQPKSTIIPATNVNYKCYYGCIYCFCVQIFSLSAFTINVYAIELNIYKCIIQIRTCFIIHLVVSAVSYFLLQDIPKKKKCFYFRLGFNACWYNNTAFLPCILTIFLNVQGSFKNSL